MKLTREDLKYPQIDAAFKYIYDNPKKYQYRLRKGIPLTDAYEFGLFNGSSLEKICSYLEENDFTGIHPFVHGYDSFEGLPKEDNNVKSFVKFAEGSYKSRFTPDEIEANIDYPTLKVHKCWFNNLCHIHIGKPAMLIHIDCDLYTSTRDVLWFLANNNLIHNNTLIAYDEYESTDDPESSGERRAHEEVLNQQYGIKTDEIYHNIYYDKDTGQRFRQNVFEIC